MSIMFKTMPDVIDNVKNVLDVLWQQFLNIECFVPSSVGPVDLEEKIVKFHQCIFFVLFCYHLPLERDVVLYLEKLEFFYQMMLCVKFEWNLHGGS